MEKPLDLQYLELMSRRTILTEAESGVLFAKGIGFGGETQFGALMRPLLPKDWFLLADLNYGTYAQKEIQIDFLLITNHGLYLFDVKNLSRYYTYEDEKWYVNGQRLPRDFFHQLQRTNDIFLTVLEENHIEMPLTRKLVLINESETVTFKKDMSHLTLHRWSIRKFVEDIIEQEKNLHPEWNIERVRDIILSSQSQPRVHTRIDISQRSFKKGVLCQNCCSNELSDEQRFHIICTKCGYVEPKVLAMIRTVCEYSVLYLRAQATKKELMEFIDHPSLNGSLEYVLKKYFKAELQGKITVYQLPMKIMEYAFPTVDCRYNSFRR